jgi:hypothetical protein
MDMDTTIKNYTIITPLSIDITTGDAITPKEVLYLFKMIFDEETINSLKKIIKY